MKNKWMIHIIFLCCLFPCIGWANPSSLIDINTTTSSSTIKIEFFITESARYHVFTLSHPDRLVIDFSNTASSTDFTEIKQKILTNTPDITFIRIGHPHPSVLRIVFNLQYSMKFKAFSKPRPGIVLYKKSLSPSPASSRPKHDTKPFIIVIDPGHGGKDPGTIGAYGTEEKNIVLSISKKLTDLINKQSHIHAVLTRDHDYFVPLRTRLKLARKGNADLFIAIHADASTDKISEGASIYALSQGGAIKEANHWLANSGNYFELSGVDMNALEDQSSTLRSVLIDLAQTATMTDSLHLGAAILNALQPMTTLHYKRVVKAPFMVLKSPDIPSVLIETGYLSHPAEEKKLRDPLYQKKIAQAIYDGISIYLKKYAMANT